MTNLTESLENRDRNAKKEQWNEDENEGMKKKQGTSRDRWGWKLMGKESKKGTRKGKGWTD